MPSIELLLETGGPQVKGITFERLKKERCIRVNLPSSPYASFTEEAEGKKKFKTASGRQELYKDEDRFIVRVVDNGVGIEDLDKAMKEGYSTAPDHIRERGFGAGMGIANMKRFADKLVIISEKNAGTQVEMIFYLPQETWPLI